MEYIDFGSGGSNVYIGGATDSCRITNGDPICWTLSINRMKPTGMKESQTQIKVWAAEYFTNEDEYPLIDNIIYQNDHVVAGEWLFGTTHSHRQGE